MLETQPSQLPAEWDLWRVVSIGTTGPIAPTCPQPAGTTGSFTVDNPVGLPLVAGETGNIQDLTLGGSFPVINFMNILTPSGLAIFDLKDLRVNTGPAIGDCTIGTGDLSPGVNCTPSGSPFTITNGLVDPVTGVPDTVSISLTVDLYGYIGSSGVAYNAANPYVGIFYHSDGIVWKHRYDPRHHRGRRHHYGSLVGCIRPLGCSARAGDVRHSRIVSYWSELPVAAAHRQRVRQPSGSGVNLRSLWENMLSVRGIFPCFFLSTHLRLRRKCFNAERPWLPAVPPRGCTIPRSSSQNRTHAPESHRLPPCPLARRWQRNRKSPAQ